jgi:hypothetical protein
MDSIRIAVINFSTEPRVGFHIVVVAHHLGPVNL